MTLALIDRWAVEYNVDVVFGYTSSLRFGVAGICRGMKHDDPWRSRYGYIMLNAKLEGKSSE